MPPGQALGLFDTGLVLEMYRAMDRIILVSYTMHRTSTPPVETASKLLYYHGKFARLLVTPPFVSAGSQRLRYIFLGS
jgi:hypothetical protein